MLRYKNFLRKKTTKIYMLIYIILFLLLSLVLSYRYNLFIDYDKNYKDTHFIVNTDKRIDDYLKKDKNIININITEIQDDKYNYEYTFYLKHYYDFANELSNIVKEVYNNNIKIHIETEFQQESYLDIGNQLEYSMVFIYVIILVGLCVIIITTSNIINDEKKTNRLFKYIGFSNEKIIVMTIFKILITIIIPIIISISTFFILNLIN